MLYQIFTQILNMSITASVVIIAVLVARGVMHRMPKKYLYLLWLIVGIRLVCPVGIDSPISLFNLVGQDVQTFSLNKEERFSVDTNTVKSTVSSVNTQQLNVNSVDSNKHQNENTVEMPNMKKDVDSVKNFTEPNVSMEKIEMNSMVKYGEILWIIGMVGILLWNFYRTFRIKRRLEKAVRYKGNIYECDNIPSPFVMGVVQPKIFIPFRLGNEEREYVLKHEQYHIKRRDHIVKLSAFLLLCLYWFHPLVWVSYFWMVRDMEMSCDEYVIQNMGMDIRKSYSKSLLGFATNQRGMTAGLLAFGETDTRRRVRNVMNFKKHGKWISIVAILLVVVVGATCLTNATTKKGQNVTIEEKKEDKGNKGEVQAVVAETTIHDYQVKLVYLPKGETLEKDEFGMYKGDFELRTYQGDKKYAAYKIQFSDEQTPIYYPAEGFDFVVKDYDGDGYENDFSLGQGQTEEPLLGNFMLYQFFTVDDYGNIIQYGLSTEDGKSLVTLPDVYSKNFECANGEVFYDKLGEEGVERTSAKFVQIISEKDISENVQPEDYLIKAVEGTMPQRVVDEIKKNGTWKLTDGCYSLVNNSKNEDVTLRLDFTFVGDELRQYVSKEYGFVDDMPEERIGIEEAKKLVATFKREFLDEMISTYYINEYIGYSGYEGEDYASFIDETGDTFLVQLSRNMVIKYDRNVVSKQDISEAKVAVEKYFKKNFNGCKLLKIWFDSEYYQRESESFITQYRTNVIILLSDFYVSKTGGDGSLNQDDTYKNWGWILAKNKKGEWKVKTYGY